jgi:HSP20 family molecular chaperone IbpA
MRCGRCGLGLEDGWHFCPRCGARKGDMADSLGRDLFSQLFSHFKDSFKNMEVFDDMFEKDIEALDLSPWFRNIGQGSRKRGMPVRGKGITVRITSGTGMRPRVDIKTYGDAGQQKIREQAYVGGAQPVRQGNAQHAAKGDADAKSSIFRRSIPKNTEEPNAEVRKVGDGVVVDIDMPGVKSQDDVEVSELSSSVEVKALAGDKAYFKILTKPERFRLSGKSFSDGKLHLEFS